MDTFDPHNALYAVAERRMSDDFPATSSALHEPNGLLAIGGDLSSARLLNAYRRGIFPWYADGQPIMWWSPDPRAVFRPDTVHVSRSLGKTLRQKRYQISFDRAFAAVIAACAGPRKGADGTWITAAMQSAYAELHARGFAHSVECWQDGELCGGLYGVALGRIFFGESMFSARRDASKVALVELCRHLVDWDYTLFDCQVDNPHLERLGAQLDAARAVRIGPRRRGVDEPASRRPGTRSAESMTEPPTLPRIGFFTSPPHECGYLPDRSATTMFADPRIRLNQETYTWLSAHGFRRSGTHVYRPHCGSCKACRGARRDRRIPSRGGTIDAPSRDNADLEIRVAPGSFETEHFVLYERYLGARHPDSQMEATNPGAYMSFLTALWCETSFYEFRLDGELLAVAVVDQLDDGLSSVYTFFSPRHAERSLGRFAVLKQIEWARGAGLPWVYLGYWIDDCRKMSYKREYEPLEYFRDGTWLRRSEMAAR